jgi:hypothetical protein
MGSVKGNRRRSIKFDQVKKPRPTPNVPVLDRLSFTADIPEGVARPDARAVVDWVEGAYKLAQTARSRGARYKHNLRLKRGDKVQVAHIAFNPLKTSNAFLRVDLNPARLLPRDMKALHAFLRYLLLERHKEILAKAKVTRIDVALDVDHVRVDDLMVFTRSGVQSGVWGKLFARDGAMTRFYIQTKVLGSVNSDQQFKVYDRAAKMADTGGDAIEHDRTRIEVQLTPRVRIDGKRSADKTERPGPPVRVGAYLNELRSLPNPFASLTVAVAPSNPEGDTLFRLFLDSCRQRGEEAALKLITDSRLQREYRLRLSRRSPDWWDPVACWKPLERLVRETDLFPSSGYGD